MSLHRKWNQSNVVDHPCVDPSTSKCITNNCRDVCNKNRINDVEKTIANKDNIIRMLQDQLKKMENLYKQHFDESEQIRLKYCLASEELEKLKRTYQQSQNEKSQIDQQQYENGIKTVRDEISELRKQFQQFIQESQFSAQSQTLLENRLNSLSNMIKEQSAALQNLVHKISESTMKSAESEVYNDNQTSNFKLPELKNENYSKDNNRNTVGTPERLRSLVEVQDSVYESFHKKNSEPNRKSSNLQTTYEEDYSANMRQVSFDRNAATNTNKADLVDDATGVESQERNKLENKVQALGKDLAKLTESTQDHQEVTIKKLQVNRQMIEDLIQENLKVQRDVISIKATLEQILTRMNSENFDSPQGKPKQPGSEDDSVATVDLFKHTSESMTSNSKGDSVSEQSVKSNRTYSVSQQIETDETDATSDEIVFSMNNSKSDSDSRLSKQSDEETCNVSNRTESNKKNAGSNSFQSDQDISLNASYMSPARIDSNSQTESMQIITIRNAEEVRRQTINQLGTSSIPSETEVKSDKSTESKPAKTTPSKKQLEDSFKMLKEHYNDLQNERTQKDKQINWMEELITYFTEVMNDNSWDNIDDINLVPYDGLGISPKTNEDNLGYYIEKVENENTKLKSTINSIVGHLKDTVLELTTKSGAEIPKPNLQPENYITECKCGLDSEERRIIETCIEECLNLTTSGDSTAMISNLEKYIDYLQNQLEVTAKIEEEIEDLRKDIEKQQK